MVKKKFIVLAFCSVIFLFIIFMVSAWFDDNYYFRRTLSLNTSIATNVSRIPIAINGSEGVRNASDVLWLWCSADAIQNTTVNASMLFNYNNLNNFTCTNSSDNYAFLREVEMGNATITVAETNALWGSNDYKVVWHFNNTNDSSGLTINATTSASGLSYVDGIFGKAINMTSTGDAMNPQWFINYSQVTGNWSIEFWVYPEHIDNMVFGRTLLVWCSSADSGSCNTGIRIKQAENPSLRWLQVWTPSGDPCGNGANTYLDTTGLLTLDKWNYIVLTKGSSTKPSGSGVNQTVWLNGILILNESSGNNCNMAGLGPPLPVTQNFLGIGSISQAIKSDNLDGLRFDEFRLLNRTLSPDEIKARYDLYNPALNYTVLGAQTADNYYLPSNVTLISYTNSTNFTTVSYFNWSKAIQNITSSTITYDLYIDNNTDFLDIVINKSSIGHNYSLSDAEKLLFNDNKYYWKVRAYDTVAYSFWSDNFTFTIDNKAPLLSIINPLPQVYGSNQSIKLNYTVVEENLSISTCWYAVNTTTGWEIFNTTIVSCLNTTFNVSGSGIFMVNVSVNDTLNNVNSSVVTFEVSLTNPVIVLNSPEDNVYLNYTNNISFNFTATDADGIDTCRLWSNFSGVWSKNYTWFNGVQSGVQNFTKVNLSDNNYAWNVWCNDTVNDTKWAYANLTFIVDTIKPVPTINSITTTAGSQTISFSHNVTDANIDYCKYSILTSLGAIDGISENISLTNCNLTNSSATTTVYGTFNLTIRAVDKAGWENVTSKLFTTVASPTPLPTSGGGGGGEKLEYVLAVALKVPKEIMNTSESTFFSDLRRAVLYARINEFCSNFSTSRSSCVIIEPKITELTEKLASQHVSLSNLSLRLWINSYNKKEIENVEVTKQDSREFSLFVATVSIISAKFDIENLDRFWLVLGNRISYNLGANKVLKSCSVDEGKLNWNCQVLNSSAVLSYDNINSPDWLFKTITNTITFVSVDNEQKIKNVVIRAITPMGLVVIIASSSFGIFIISLFYRNKNLIKKFKWKKLKR